MKDLALVLQTDAENPVIGDLRLVNGQLLLVEGSDAKKQDLVVCLRWFKGEWFLDRRTGMPYLQSILGTRTPLVSIERIFRAAIQQRAWVASIETIRLAFDATTRSLSVANLRVRAKDGDVVELADFIVPEVG